MLGHRGVRLLISYPEVAEMQSHAIFEAATEIHRRTGKAPIPEVMVPLVASRAELDRVKERIVAVAEQVAKETGVAITYSVGTMIELPRACMAAGESLSDTRTRGLMRELLRRQPAHRPSRAMA